MKIAVIVEAAPREGEPFTERDLLEAVQAACLEVHPVRDGHPLVPLVRQLRIRDVLVEVIDEYASMTWDMVGEPPDPGEAVRGLAEAVGIDIEDLIAERIAERSRGF